MNDINVIFGRRLRRRRQLLGLTMKELATVCGIRFQQIQKYECGANGISALRIWQLSQALQVPVDYFFDGLDAPDPERSAAGGPSAESRRTKHEEMVELAKAYDQLAEEPRRRFLELVKALSAEEKAAGAENEDP